MSESPFYTNEVDQAERIAALESELKRIRPVYEAACAWPDDGHWHDGAGRWFQ